MVEKAPQKDAEELIRVDLPWYIEYRKTAGEYASVYLNYLREKGKRLAARCPECQKLYSPPTCVCATCHTKIPPYPEGWFELSGKARLVYWDKQIMPMMNILGQERLSPNLLCTVILDEGLAMMGVLDVLADSPEEARVQNGLRLELVLKPWSERIGTPVEDVQHWKILWDEPVVETKLDVVAEMSW